MTETIQYAFKVTEDEETPCHLSEIKKGDVYYLVVDSKRSELLKATEDAFNSNVSGKSVWSIPHVPYE